MYFDTLVSLDYCGESTYLLFGIALIVSWLNPRDAFSADVYKISAGHE